MRYVTYAVLALGVVATLVVMLAMGGDVGVVFSVFALWALLPYAVLAVAAHRSRTPLFGRACAVVSLLVVIFAVVVYGDAYLNPDAQGGLVFVFVPLLQLAAILLTAALAGVARVLWRRAPRTTVPGREGL